MADLMGSRLEAKLHAEITSAIWKVLAGVGVIVGAATVIILIG